MKKSKRVSEPRPAARRARAFRAGLFACALLVAGIATAAATYASRNVPPRPAANAAGPRPADPHVTVEVGGRKMHVNAQTLQQGPLTPEQARQLADQLEGNKATDGLVPEKQADGSVSVDLQGRFQNVTLAKRNDDGSISSACVDTPEAADSFLTRVEKTATNTETDAGTGLTRKAVSKR